MVRHENLRIERKGGTLSGDLEGGQKGFIIGRRQIDWPLLPRAMR